MKSNLSATQKTIVKILFVEKESSRSILAKRLSLTNAALTLALKPLLESNIVLETKNDVQRVGRKELLLTLNKKYGYFLGIDIRKHHLYFYLMDLGGNLISTSDDNSISLSDFIRSKKKKILSVGVTLRGLLKENVLEERYPELNKEIENLGLPVYVFNNVDCLADIYIMHHEEDKNFLLVKYGPGVGSSIYVNGHPLGSLSELGHTYYQDKTLEETISYSALLDKDIEEAEATKLILEDKSMRNKVLKVLSFALVNADALLSLQKIVLSGQLLSDEKTVNDLKKEIQSIKKEFDHAKLVVYPDYHELNMKKSCIGALIKTFD